MRHLLAMALLLTVAACSKGNVRPEDVRPPEIVQVPVVSYVPIDVELTKRCTWIVTGPLEEMPSVARGRKKCLQVYEVQFDAIRAVQGRPVPGNAASVTSPLPQPLPERSP